MDLQLAGKRALVTGSSSGIGRGIAAFLAREGVTVVVHGRNRERTERAAEMIRSAGGTAHVAIGDLATDEGAAGVIRGALEQAGGIDILVNNAGGNEAAGGGMPGWFDVQPMHWIGTMQQNVVSIVRMVQALVPPMRERGWGRVINIASAAGSQATAETPDYCAAKAAVINMTLSLSKALARSGVVANAVSPGCTRTEALERWLGEFAINQGWPEDYDAREARFMDLGYLPVATQRLGRVEDIGAMVAFLASPLAGFITGANYRIDGGQCQSVN